MKRTAGGMQRGDSWGQEGRGRVKGTAGGMQRGDSWGQEGGGVK